MVEKLNFMFFDNPFSDVSACGEEGCSVSHIIICGTCLWTERNGGKRVQVFGCGPARQNGTGEVGNSVTV